MSGGGEGGAGVIVFSVFQCSSDTLCIARSIPISRLSYNHMSDTDIVLQKCVEYVVE